MHPCEYSILNSPPPPQYSNLWVLKIFIDIYYDDFGTYWNVYHLLGGVYIQVGNMTFDMRQHLRNHFVLGFVPFGGHFKEFICPFIRDMKLLEKGVSELFLLITQPIFLQKNLEGLRSISSPGWLYLWTFLTTSISFEGLCRAVAT